MSATTSPDVRVQLTAARRIAASQYRQVDVGSFNSVRLQGRFLGWTFIVGTYPEGRFGFIGVNGAASVDLYDLRLHARMALYKHATDLQQ